MIAEFRRVSPVAQLAARRVARPEGEGSMPGGLALGLGAACECERKMTDEVERDHPQSRRAHETPPRDGRPSRRHKVPISIGWVGPGESPVTGAWRAATVAWHSRCMQRKAPGNCDHLLPKHFIRSNYPFLVIYSFSSECLSLMSLLSSPGE